MPARLSIHPISAALCLALIASACSGSLPTLPDEIQRQTGEAAAPEALAVAQNSEGLALPAIRLGSPEFRASSPASFQIASGRVQLVEFFAYWCAVCKAMAPTVHGLEGMYADQIQFVYLDREDPATLPYQEQLGYIYQPHFFLLDPGGGVLAQWRGYVDGVELQRALLGALGN
jgi:thiol-disulfide isomerase/thioredoxin